MPKTAKRVGFLVTGSEITSGEILNLNSAKMSELLQEQGIFSGEHLLCDDNLQNLEAAFAFLLSRHDAVITTGGLGPTSDDVTRIAIANEVKQNLVFHEQSWQKIKTRMSLRNLPIPENNKQQAFFPEHATVLENEHGTANGCYLKHNGKWVFMLPGPPRECLPMFKEQVLPLLTQAEFSSPLRLFRWRLIGVSESAIAETLEPICKTYGVEFAYRASYPFVDIKLMLNPHHKSNFKTLLTIERAVKPYFATHLNETLTEQLRALLLETKKTLFVEDHATQGYFLHKLALPPHAIKTFKPEADVSVVITGLTHFWQKDTTKTIDGCDVEITLPHKVERYVCDKILLRGEETLDYVAEFTALKVLQAL